MTTLPRVAAATASRLSSLIVADAAVRIAVLTGGAERVGTGLRLLLADEAAKLIVSGAHRDAALADLARGAGVAPDEVAPAEAAGRVALGRAAASTHGNAAEIAAWARENGIGSIRVVTAGYHMPRALLELRRALPPGIVLLPHPVVPAALRAPGGGWRSWRLLAGEYLKLLGAWLGLARPGGDRTLAPPRAGTQEATP